MPGDSMIQKQV